MVSDLYEVGTPETTPAGGELPRRRRGLRCVGHKALLYPASSWMATWRNGYAADCKSVYAGSIPAVASRGFQKGLCFEPNRMYKAGLRIKREQFRRHARLFPGSSAVEQPAVNRLVAGSNPARGASSERDCERNVSQFPLHSFLQTPQASGGDLALSDYPPPSRLPYSRRSSIWPDRSCNGTVSATGRTSKFAFSKEAPMPCAGAD